MVRDPTTLFPESEFVTVRSVPVFKEHSRFKSGRKVVVGADDLKQIAANVNSQTEAIKGVKCKTFNQDALPEPHPAAKGTEAVTRKNQDHA
jgi:hypothetical protein